MKREASITIPDSKLALPIAGRDHIQGPIDAPMTLLEYGDYECPYCGEAHYVVKTLQKRLGHRLCFAFRNFPLVNSHPHAEHAAEAAEAADAQGKIWEMHDVLFENQRALDDQNIEEYAAALDLDADRLIREVLAGEHIERIREDLQAGRRAGVGGTPTFFINGVLYEGEPEVESLIEALSGDRPRRR
jgi:protein-disulfide isomerase